MHLSRVFFITSLTLWAATIFLQSTLPMLLRDAPPETDDGYVYIVHGVQATECEEKACPGMNSIKQYVEYLSTNGNTATATRLHGQFLEKNYPLYSHILVLLHAIGIDWETSFSLLWIGITLLMLGGGALCLYRFFPHEAPLAILLLCAYPLAGHGFQYYVPTSLATAIGLWSLAVTTFRSRYMPLWVAGLSIPMIFAHPTGIVISFTLACVLARNYSETRHRRGMYAGLGIICMTLFVRLFPWNTLSEISASPLHRFDIANALGNFTAVIEHLGKRVRYFGYTPVAPLAVFAVGCMSLPVLGRKSIVAVLTSGAVVLSASVFISTLAPGSVFLRLAPLYFVVFCGVLACGLIRLGSFALNTFKRLKKSAGDNSSGVPKKDIAIATVNLGLATFFSLMVALGALSITRSNAFTLYHRHNTALEKEQADILFSNIAEDQAVYYQVGLPLLFFMSHGGLQHEAVLGKLRPEQAKLYRERIGNPKIGAIAAINPTTRFRAADNTAPWHKEGNIRLPAGTELGIHSESPIDVRDLKITVMQHSAETIFIDVDLPEGKQTLWLDPDTGFIEAEKEMRAFRFTLRTLDDIDISGIDIAPYNSLKWPWDKGVSLTAASKEGERVVSFSTEVLAERAGVRLAVLDDRGSLFIAKAFPQQAAQ